MTYSQPPIIGPGRPAMDSNGYVTGSWAPAPPLPSPPPRKRRTALVVGLAAAALLVLAGVGLLGVTLLRHSPVPLPGATQTMTVSGTFSIGGDCSGWGYDDIRAGTQVVITDEKQTVIGTGQLVPAGVVCRWNFTIRDVPTGRKFYGITVSHRGTLEYTEAQIRQGLNIGLGN